MEPFFSHGHLLLGMMRSQKAFDLLRDPRCLLHSSISDPGWSKANSSCAAGPWTSGTQICGKATARRTSSGGRAALQKGFPFHVFSLDVESAALIRWDIEKGEMIIRQWSPDHGETEARRKYP